MKTVLSICIAIALWGCSKETPTETPTADSDLEAKTAISSAIPTNLISLEKAKEQLVNYNEAHPQELGAEYALRTWISIEEMKAYIQYIEQASAEKGIKLTGIDFIHTQYKKAEPGSPNPNNEVYDKTLMLAPTYGNGTRNIAFDPIYSEQGKPKDLKDLLSELVAESKEEKSAGGKKSSIGNTMTSCPNACE